MLCPKCSSIFDKNRNDDRIQEAESQGGNKKAEPQGSMGLLCCEILQHQTPHQKGYQPLSKELLCHQAYSS